MFNILFVLILLYLIAGLVNHIINIISFFLDMKNSKKTKRKLVE